MNIIYKYGIEMIHKTGYEYTITCPVCQADIKEGHDRCFMILEPNNERFYCRQCQNKGSLPVFFLLLSGKTPETATKQDWIEAYKRAGKDFNPTHKLKKTYLPFSEKQYWEDEQKSDVRDNNEIPLGKWSDTAQQFIEKSKVRLKYDSEGKAYLESRGIRLDTAERFSIGWNNSTKYQNMRSWGIEPEGDKTKLILPKGLVIPTFKENIPYFISIRRTDWTKESTFSKFHTVRGSKGIYFFSDNGFDEEYGDYKPIFIFESVLDAVLCFQESEGLITTAAASGIGKPSMEEVWRINKAQLIVYCFDSLDEQAKTEREKWRKISRDFSFKKRFVLATVPLGKDPTELWQLGGNVLQWIEDTIDHNLPGFFNHT